MLKMNLYVNGGLTYYWWTYMLLVDLHVNDRLVQQIYLLP